MNDTRRELAEGVITAIFIVCHVVAAGLVLVGGFFLHYLLERMGNPMMFDVVPWRYAVDVLDLSIMIVLFLGIVRMAKRLGRPS